MRLKQVLLLSLLGMVSEQSIRFFSVCLTVCFLLTPVDIVDVLLKNIPSAESYERSLMHVQPLN